MKPLDLEDRLVEFTVRVVNVFEALPDSKAGNHIAGQLVRSGPHLPRSDGNLHVCQLYDNLRVKRPEQTKATSDSLCLFGVFPANAIQHLSDLEQLPNRK